MVQFGTIVLAVLVAVVGSASAQMLVLCHA
jgi:hypothetical protein